MQVLIVEDDAFIRLEAVDEVEAMGWLPVEAATIFEAVACWRRERIEAAIVDLHLPDGSGTDLIRQLRADVPDLPIVVYTGYAAQDPPARGLPSDVLFAGKPAAKRGALAEALLAAQQRSGSG